MSQFFVSYHGGRPFKTDEEAKANQAHRGHGMRLVSSLFAMALRLAQCAPAVE